MSVDSIVYNAAKKLVDVLNFAADETLPRQLASIVKEHSAGAAAAGVAAGWLPGIGGIVALVSSGGFVWTMYGRINKEIGVPLKENIIKTLASGVATNLASSYLAGIAVGSVLSLIPGIGNVGASVLVGSTVYALTIASGVVYLKLLTQLFGAGRDPSTMTVDALKRAAEKAMNSKEVKDAVDAAKESYKKDKSR